MKNFKKHTFYILFTFVLVTVSFAKVVPNLTSPVMDEANVLDSKVKQELRVALKGFQEKTGNQLQIFIVDSLDGDSLEGFSIRTVDKWKLGSNEKDNGILFLVAVKDRKMRIEVGRGLEGDLTDIRSGRIIDYIKPYFKRQDYNSGVIIAVNAIAAALGGDFDKAIPKKKRSRRKRGGVFWPFLTIIILMMLMGRGRRGRGSSGLSWFLLGTLLGGSSSGRGGFGGGGSSWGGGGGGFSGGGASGSW